MSSLTERIASLAFSTFDRLPEKCKPRTLPNEKREWTPMSAVILVQNSDADTDDEILTCVSLATGTKCLPHTSLSQCNGTVLHDSHAEILALRGLNHFLLSEIRHMLLNSEYVSPFINCVPPSEAIMNTKHRRPYRMRSSISIHLFTTSPPCGDASMDILIASRPHDNVPWTKPALTSSCNNSAVPDILHGHEHFSHLGFVRLKPSRADAPPTHSKSCTDKLALKQFTGLLGFPLDILMEPAWLGGVVVPGNAYHEAGWKRAFGMQGRLKNALSGGVEGKFFSLHVLPATCPEFRYAKPGGGLGECAKVGNVAAL